MSDEAEARPWSLVPFDEMCQIDPPNPCTACAPGVTDPSQCPKPFLLDDDQLAEVGRRWAEVRARRPASSADSRGRSRSQAGSRCQGFRTG